MRTEEIAQKAPESERALTAGELFDGNISKLGRFVGNIPLTNKHRVFDSGLQWSVIYEDKPCHFNCGTVRA